jgi:hypothetical protein
MRFDAEMPGGNYEKQWVKSRVYDLVMKPTEVHLRL